MSNESPLESGELLGAVDIVEAFTTLRHELKLQVRGGRELQQSLDQRLQQLEERLHEQRVQQHSALVKQIDGSVRGAQAQPVADADTRQLAEALAEVEESLERAVETLTGPLVEQTPVSVAQPLTQLLEQFDQVVASATWTQRFFARLLVSRLRKNLESGLPQSEPVVRDPARERLEVSGRGVELLLERVRRLMEACQLERQDVLGQPFDAETMRAIDVVTSDSVPSSHVAEQLRPLYRWRGQVLKYADVRLAR